VEEEGALGDLLEPVLQALQIRRPVHLFALGRAKDEVAEPEVLEHQGVEVLELVGRALQEEARPHLVGQGLVLRVGGVEDDRDVRVVPALVEHRVGDLDEAGDVGAHDVVARLPYSSAVSTQLLVDVTS
jgi:hypothetical protein